MPAPAPARPPQGGEPMSTVSTNRAPLRRAVYVHVSDLISSYDINHSRLELELSRAKLENEKGTENPPQARSTGVPTELDTSPPQKRLQPPRGGYNLCVLVGKLDVVVDKNRVDGSRVRLAEVDVGDETGTVSLRARDEQIDILKEVAERNGAVVLRNCTIELYQGKHIRLAVTKWGKLSPFPDNVASTPPPPTKINHDRNFSMIDLSIVASEMVSYSNERYQQAGDTDSLQQSSSGGSGVHSPPQQMYVQRGRGNRRQTHHRQKPAAQQQHYSDRYPGGLHGYGTGFDGRMNSSSFPYSLRQTQEAAQHQQMMMHHHHQYEMQQRHLHQMYHSSTPSPHQQERSAGGPSSSSMNAPVIPNPGSFEAYGETYSDAYGSPGVHLQPGAQGVNQFVHPPGTHQNATYPTSPSTHAHQTVGGDEYPASPPMNPQAPTFDPASTSLGHHHHSNR